MNERFERISNYVKLDDVILFYKLGTWYYTYTNKDGNIIDQFITGIDEKYFPFF
jgi:hypothetical protein